MDTRYQALVMGDDDIQARAAQYLAGWRIDTFDLDLDAIVEYYAGDFQLVAVAAQDLDLICSLQGHPGFGALTVLVVDTQEVVAATDVARALHRVRAQA